MIENCFHQIVDQVNTYAKNEYVPAWFEAKVKQGYKIGLVWQTQNPETTYELFDAEWKAGNVVDRATKVNLIKAFKEIGNALIREHNAQAAKLPKECSHVYESHSMYDMQGVCIKCGKHEE